MLRIVGMIVIVVAVLFFVLVIGFAALLAGSKAFEDGDL